MSFDLSTCNKNNFFSYYNSESLDMTNSGHDYRNNCHRYNDMILYSQRHVYQ